MLGQSGFPTEAAIRGDLEAQYTFFHSPLLRRHMGACQYEFVYDEQGMTTDRLDHKELRRYITERFTATQPFTTVRALPSMYTEVDGQRTPLDKGFVAILELTREGPLVCMDALVPGQVRSAAKRLQSAIHLWRERILLCSPPRDRERGAFLAEY